MKIRTLVFLACVLSGMLLSVLCGNRIKKYIEPKAPRVSISNYVTDFGNVKPGERLKCEFEIRNEGASDLTFKSAVTSCGCTSAALSQDVISPEQKAKLKVELFAALYRKPISETVTLTTNDPQSPYIQFRLTAHVTPAIDISPMSFNFGDLTFQELPTIRSVQLKLTTKRSSGSSVRWHINNSSTLVEKLHNTTNNSAQVDVVIPKDQVPGSLMGTITAIATIDGNPVAERQIACVGRVLGPIGSTPSSIVWNWKYVKSDKPDSRNIELLRIGNRDIAIQVSGNLAEFVHVDRNDSKLNVALNPKASVINQASRASRMSGALYVEDIKSKVRILAIPIIIIGT